MRLRAEGVWVEKCGQSDCRRSAALVHFLIVAAAALCILSVAQAPALWTVLAHHDQYRLFAETLGNPAIKHACEADRQYLWLYKIGRPLTAELECMIFRHTGAPSDLTPFRQLTVALQAVAAAVLAATLRRCRLSWVSAGAIGTAVFLLPGELNAVFMANLPNVLTPILALLSHTLLEMASNRHRGWFYSSSGWVMIMASWACLAAALLLFPALALFFLTATFSYVLLRADERGLRMVIRDTIFFASVAVPYYILLTKWYEPTYALGQSVPWNYTVGVSLGALAFGCLKVILFLPAMFNLWNVYPIGAVAILAAAAIAIARLAAQYRKSDIINRIGGRGYQRFLLLALLFGIANIVVITSPVVLVYRVIVPQTAIVLILLFACMVAIVSMALDVQWQRAEGPVAICLLATAAVLGGWTTSENVFASALERGYLRSVIANTPAGSFDEVAIIEPPRGEHALTDRGLNGRSVIGDEFNMPSTLGSINLGSDVPDMVRAVMIELNQHDRPVVDASLPIRSEGRVNVTLLRRGRVVVSAANGWKAQGEIQGDLILLPMGLVGVLSSDHRTITWNVGVIWQNGPPSLTGVWTAVLDPRAITVTRYPSGEFPVASRTLTVDMSKAAFPSARW